MDGVRSVVPLVDETDPPWYRRGFRYCEPWLLDWTGLQSGGIELSRRASTVNRSRSINYFEKEEENRVETETDLVSRLCTL